MSEYKIWKFEDIDWPESFYLSSTGQEYKKTLDGYAVPDTTFIYQVVRFDVMVNWLNKSVGYNTTVCEEFLKIIFDESMKRVINEDDV